MLVAATTTTQMREVIEKRGSSSDNGTIQKIERKIEINACTEEIR